LYLGDPPYASGRSLSADSPFSMTEKNQNGKHKLSDAPLNFKQELTACFGQPVSENPTQAMIEAAYQHHGLDWRYLTIEVSPDGLRDAVNGVRAMGFRGFNCTIPHKVAVIEHLDELGESAALMGAVNCVCRRGDRLVGENTDGKGFVESLREQVDPTGQRVVIFGAGGAARAIGVEVALAGATHITIVNRTAERGNVLVELLNEKTPADAEFVLWDGEYTIPDGTGVVINATSIGLYPDVDAQLAINLDSLSAGMVVADVIPNPPRTHLVREATQRGCKVIDGLGMLVNQGVIGVKYWTGIDVDAKVMRQALEAVFGS
jgi:shikimate dehydrogenase